MSGGKATSANEAHVLKYLQVGQHLSRGSQNHSSGLGFQVSLKGSHLFQDQDLNVSDFTLTYFSHLYTDIISKAL